jgi:hypothetical protein
LALILNWIGAIFSAGTGATLLFTTISTDYPNTALNAGCHTSDNDVKPRLADAPASCDAIRADAETAVGARMPSYKTASNRPRERACCNSIRAACGLSAL